MKRSIAVLLDEAKNKMSAFVALANYRFMNLCVDAEPASLLCITIEAGDAKLDLEDVADVSSPQKDQFALFPKENNPALIFAICKAVKTAHPEFKVEVKGQNEEDGDNSDENDEGNDSDEETEKYILLTMPEINKDRRDFIINGVDILQKACQMKLDAISEEYVVKITAKLALDKPEELDEAKDNLQDLYDKHKDMLVGFTDNKKQAVEEAYQRYLAEQEEKQAQQQELDEAHGTDKGLSMNMEE